MLISRTLGLQPNLAKSPTLWKGMVYATHMQASALSFGEASNRLQQAKRLSHPVECRMYCQRTVLFRELCWRCLRSST
eukprot:1577868-Amphidinium_carterae.2